MLDARSRRSLGQRQAQLIWLSTASGLPWILAAGLETTGYRAHTMHMTDANEQPVMLPFQDKEGTGWHVVIRYHHGHERRIDGFATEEEAMNWIVANADQVDQ